MRTSCWLYVNELKAQWKTYASHRSSYDIIKRHMNIHTDFTKIIKFGKNKLIPKLDVKIIRGFNDVFSVFRKYVKSESQWW